MAALVVSAAMLLSCLPLVQTVTAAPAEFQTIYRSDDFDDGDFQMPPETYTNQSMRARVAQ